MSIGLQITSCVTDAVATAKACRSEANILRSVRGALERALGWDVASTGFTQKLCSVHFALKSLDRHVQRMMELEERGGYMAVVGDTKPNLRDRAELLQAEHEMLRERFGQVMTAFEPLPRVVALNTSQQDRFVQLCDELDMLLQDLDHHEAREAELLQDVLLYDEGGEG